jgi:hypothetical protein
MWLLWDNTEQEEERALVGKRVEEAKSKTGL